MSAAGPVVREATSDAAIERCFPVLHQLRPHVAREGFVERVRRQAANGYRIAYVEAGGDVVAVAGWRLSECLSVGRTLYVDDLVTDAGRRSEGHGERLLTWLRERARAEGCRVLELDSGVQRAGAHRFYFRHGLAVTGFHFETDLG